ncbi:hypothetical protein [Sphingomonas sp.]|uniref:hypothetical protein n=1 Tax=Sphingomonas sp. TaxID=28214 RepID=UPI0035AE5EB6
MRTLLLLLLCVSLSSCDRLSQRVWNCSADKLDVLKVNEPDFEIVETIPARSWIASMKGGAQITGIMIADGKRAKVLWHKGQAVLTSRSNSADEVCAERTNGIVVQQF